MLNKQGVTLVELLVVISIFIVISLLIFPLFIQTLRLQQEMTVEMQMQQYRQRWLSFSREFNNALRGFSNPEIEIMENQLVVREEETLISVQWLSEISLLELVIFPDFYLTPQSRNFRFPAHAQIEMEYQQNTLTLSIQKEEFHESFQVHF